MSAWVQGGLIVKSRRDSAVVCIGQHQHVLDAIEARSLSAWLWEEASHMELPERAQGRVKDE